MGVEPDFATCDDGFTGQKVPGPDVGVNGT